MTKHTPQFDPLYFFLGISQKDQPPNHYRLLGIELFEPSDEIISAAADRQMGHLQQHESGDHGDRVTELLVNVARARLCLLDPKRREPYDAQLRSQLEERERSLHQAREEELRRKIGAEIEASLKQEFDVRLQQAIAQQLYTSESTENARQEAIRRELQVEFDRKLDAERSVLNAERTALSTERGVLVTERAELEKTRRDVAALQQRLQQLNTQPPVPPAKVDVARRAPKSRGGVFAGAGGNSKRVWGIEIGQCSLKALCCEQLETGGLNAQAFDYIEYPKILSQPEAMPDELIGDALAQLLSRNDFKDARIAISVPSHSALVRFPKIPPVERKKLADIVQYCAKQEIPFALEDVVWAYQQVASGKESEGFLLEPDILLIAMKREQVLAALEPFNRAGLPVDMVQIKALTFHNLLAHDLLANGPTLADYDPDAPPDSLAALSIGTDNSDLVISDGFRFWIRNIPLGGNHFTKQLTRELKLTFANAEHLKRNVSKSNDPKTAFQAMRPVFQDFVSELQRSLGYFKSVHRQAKIKELVLHGNTCKLPGLRQYFSQNLGYGVSVLEAPPSRLGEGILTAPLFQENRTTFGVCHGLCVQGLGQARISVDLLPPELRRGLVNRLKRLASRKKS